MQKTSVAFPAASQETSELSDFSTDRRVLLLSAMALVIGMVSALVADALMWLIAAITNLAFYQRFSAGPVVPQGNHLGYWVI
ncbi:MAG TPA: chloride channel protein, partial [Candidatus Binatia bacterium]|nr:chloride channel protein [Candidatus Binatia bacterium]